MKEMTLDAIVKLQTRRHLHSTEVEEKTAKAHKNIVKHGPNQQSRLASLPDWNFIHFNNSKAVHQGLMYVYTFPLHLSTRKI